MNTRRALLAAVGLFALSGIFALLFPSNALAERVFVTAIILPIIGLLTLPRLTMTIARATRIITFLSLCIAAAIINAVFWDLLDFTGDDLIIRSAGIASVLAAAGIICTPILYKVQSIRRDEGELRPIPLRLTCPRCAREIAVKQGPSKCPHCALRFTIKIEEPRCACGYPLYGLESDKCPECGRHIPESDRWIPPVSSAHTPDSKPVRTT